MVDGLCIGCTSGDQLDPAQLYNGAVTTYGLQNVDLTAAIEMNFTGSVQRRSCVELA
jgi:hypothetical protein